ncbi:C3HC zinc finger-like-domain-containing protein [Pyronema omphalodes]|nr:C3HC zinc finger-like-domain-containing protein [Pyronema omphalodes]
MLYSTKRKWDKLMNSTAGTSKSTPAEPLETTTTITITPAPEASEAPEARNSAETTESRESRLQSPDDSKKRRFDATPRSAGNGKPSIRAVSPSGSISSVRSTVTTLSSLHQDGKGRATYAPWDRDAFLNRLGTFRFVDKWSAKPTAVNEVAWSKRGWICVDKNRVRCVTCKNELLVKVESDDEVTEAGRELVEKYEDMVIDAHDESCLWRKRGSDDTIYRLPLQNSSQARPAFSARYNSLLKIRTSIPPKLSYPAEVDPAALHYPSECSDHGPVDETAALLALFGWQNMDPGIPSLVTCSACFRRLGLWLFQEKEGEASVCRLDLVEEHRDYCPWINASSQGKEEAWKTLHRVLQQAPKNLSSSASVYSVASIATQHSVLSNAERDAEDNSKLQKLRRLKTMYFGKGKKKEKGKDMSAEV